MEGPSDQNDELEVLLVEEITVSQAALRLSMSYGQVLRRIMLREIRGWQLDNRAWRVDARAPWRDVRV